MKRLPYRQWTNHEIKMLTELYHTHGATKLATMMDRSNDAIRQAARKLGLKADKNLYKPINYYIRRKLNGK